jgi:hypothetical protein
MALQYSGLGNCQSVGATPASVCTNPSGGKTYLRGLVIHNTSSSAVVFKFYVVPNSSGSLGSAATSNRIANVTIPANETVNWEFPSPGIALIGPNDALFAEAGTAGVINVLPLGDQDV